MTKGIDISFWQGDIDFAKVKQNVDFVILREGYRNTVDSKFFSYVKSCNTNSIPIHGVYHFCYSINTAEVLKEAKTCIANVKKAGLSKSSIIFFDFEYDTVTKAKNRGVTLGKAECISFTRTFCDYVKSQGYRTGVYCNNDYYKHMYDKATLNAYPLWLADYSGDADYPCLYHQYTSDGKVSGINGKVDMNYYFGEEQTNTQEEQGMANKETIVKNVINDAVKFATDIANDNTHGYSQAVRSLYNITNPKSFDCSSLVCTAFYYALTKNGLTTQANYLKANCSYTGNMLKMVNCGFEIVAQNQTAHASMKKGDIELNTTHHTALAIDGNNIVHARSSEGTSDTKDNSGNEIRTQPWYNYSHGWTHRLRFTGAGIDFTNVTTTSSSTSTPATTSTTDANAGTFTVKEVKNGSKGNHALLLQEILKARGFRGLNNNELALDGEFGTNSVKALKDYQTSRKTVLAVDGVCGKATWKDLLGL